MSKRIEKAGSSVARLRLCAAQVLERVIFLIVQTGYLFKNFLYMSLLLVRS